MVALSTHTDREPALSERASLPWLTVGANLDARFGGVSAVMPPLLRSVGENGSVRMSLAAFCGPDENIDAITAAAGQYERYSMRGVKSLFANGKSGARLRHQVSGSAGVHVHGIWQEHCALAARAARAQGKPYIISAHGMLDPWALKQKRLKKDLYMGLVEKQNLRGAACLHALTSAEAEAYARLAPGVPIAIIPNGAQVPETADSETFLSRFPHLRNRRLVLFLARIHPKKGLDILCEAWRSVSRRWLDAHLVIAGPDSENTQAPLQASIRALGLEDRITFTGMLAGQEKWSALAAAHVFVLPSYSEGLSVSVLEALGMALPVVVSEQCHVAGIAGNECGWQIQPRVSEIEAALDAFLSLPVTETQRMGMNGRALVRRAYSWNTIGQQLSALYLWVSGGPRPVGFALIST